MATRRSWSGTSTGCTRAWRALALDIGRSREALTADLYALLTANDMTDGVHVRLMVTRGVKRTPYQDPRVTVGPATIVMIAEHKQPSPAAAEHGITLFTTHVRAQRATRSTRSSTRTAS